MHELLVFIERVGVPGALLLILLLRIEPHLTRLTDAVTTLTLSLNGGCPLKNQGRPPGG